MASDASRLRPILALSSVLALSGLAAVVAYWLEDSASLNRQVLVGIVLSYLTLWGLFYLWSDAHRLHKLLLFFMTTGSLAVVVGLLELLVLVRVADFRLIFNVPIAVPWSHPENLLDPKLLHIHRPYYRLSWGGVDYRYDRHGFRNESDLQTADVVVIGDSFIEGWGVAAADLITSQLAGTLGLTVANLGQSWYGPQQELEVLLRFGLPLRPKVCVWTFYDGNDLLDVVRYDEAVENWKEFSDGLHSFRQRSFTKNVVRALRSLRDGNADFGDPDAARWDPASGAVEDCFGNRSRTAFLDPDQIPLTDKDRAALEETRSVLIRANEACRRMGSRFVVVFAPTKFRVYRQLTTFSLEARPREWVINDLPQRLEAIVRESLPAGEFLDLTPVLSARARCGPPLYYPVDTHWSPEGHRVAAEAIAELLTEAKHDSAGVRAREP
jgi:hypothetical protein